MKSTLVVLCLFIIFSYVSGKKDDESYAHYHKVVAYMARKVGHSWQYLCSGTIVNKRYVLSSKTCGQIPTEEELKLEKVAIRGGTKWIDRPGGLTHPIENITVQKDVAFIRVKTYFLNDAVEKPIPLISSGTFRYNATNRVHVYGWGASFSLRSATGQLKSVELELITNADCHQYYPFVNKTTKDFVCAMPIQGVVCSDDDGAPMLSKNILIGIALKQNTACTTSQPTVYARLSSYMWEILTVMDMDGFHLKYYPLY